jgi:hypothetical protein
VIGTTVTLTAPESPGWAPVLFFFARGLEIGIRQQRAFCCGKPVDGCQGIPPKEPDRQMEVHKMTFTSRTKRISCTPFGGICANRDIEVQIMHHLFRKAPVPGQNAKMSYTKCPSFRQKEPNRQKAVHEMHFV